MNVDDDVKRVSASLHAFAAYMKNLSGSSHLRFIDAEIISNKYGIPVKEASAAVERIAASCVQERERLLAMLKKGKTYLETAIQDLELTIKESSQHEQEEENNP